LAGRDRANDDGVAPNRRAKGDDFAWRRANQTAIYHHANASSRAYGVAALACAADRPSAVTADSAAGHCADKAALLKCAVLGIYAVGSIGGRLANVQASKECHNA
jgi:hypothetical protein